MEAKRLYQCVGLLLLGLLAEPNYLMAEEAQTTSSVTLPDKQTYWNFNQADIQTLIQQVAKETGKNFVIDPRVQGKVTVISHFPLSKEDAYQVFLSILNVHGFSAIQSGNIVKIMPLSRTNIGSANTRYKMDKADELIIKVIDIKYLSPADIVQSIKLLIPKTSHISAADNSNQIIIADTSGNVAKIEKIIDQMDTGKQRSVDLVKLQYASALDMEILLNNLISKDSGSKNKVAVAADERTNTLLISGSTIQNRSYIKKVIDQLDQKSNDNNKSEVIYLKYVNAADIAPIIGAFLEDAAKTSDDQKTRKTADESNTSGTNLVQTATTGTTSIPNHLRALQNYNQNQGTQGVLFGESEGQPKSGVVNRFVQWEETTNAIILKAPPILMRAAQSIISKLDIRRPQVLIEVIIAEITVDRAKELGVEWAPSQKASVKFGTRFPTTPGNTSNSIVGGLLDGAVETLGNGLSIGVFRHDSLRVLAKALAADTTANIVSTPSLVTLDNQAALIKVGERVPFAIGQTNNDNIGGNPFTSFDREEVGLSLTIRPQITRSGAIRLEIENILSNIVPNSANNNTGGNPTTSERTIVTNVMVDDGKILVLGGLIQDSWQDIQSRVPFVGRIPLLKHLFGNATKQLVKKNLVIFLRPVIMRNDKQSIEVSNERYNQLRKAQLLSYDVHNRNFIDEPVSIKPLSNRDYYTSQELPEPLEHNNNPAIVLPEPYDVIADDIYRKN